MTLLPPLLTQLADIPHTHSLPPLTVLKGLYSVKKIQNKLCGADSDLVKIFDTDCNVVGTVKMKEGLDPYDIAVGENSLYVAAHFPLNYIPLPRIYPSPSSSPLLDHG